MRSNVPLLVVGDAVQCEAAETVCRQPGVTGNFRRETGGGVAQALLAGGIGGGGERVCVEPDQLAFAAEIMAQQARIPAAARGVFAHLHVGCDLEEAERFGRMAELVAGLVLGAGGVVDRAGERLRMLGH